MLLRAGAAIVGVERPMDNTVSRSARPVSAPVPERIGRYEILLPIASGGMATVYLARSRGVGGFERDVALKLTHAHLRDNADFAADLLAEAKLAVRIRHPNVVPVLDVDDDPLGLFLVMEYVEGDTLANIRRRAAKAKLAIPRAIGMRIIIDALSGLHAAHELRDETGDLVNLVHRDFSPQNILVGLDGIAKLTDFGIAKVTSHLGDTKSGLVKGKMGYMSPEQAQSRPLDRRCDVWAAGIVAWELAASRRLYPSDTDVGTLLKVVTEQPPLVSTVNPDVPPAVEAVIARALTMDLSKRMPSALVFVRELRAAMRESGEIADHEQVGEFVANLVGSKLAERRARAAEIVRLRKKIENVASPQSAANLEEGLAAVRNRELLDVDIESGSSAVAVVVPQAPRASTQPPPVRKAPPLPPARVRPKPSANETPMAKGISKAIEIAIELPKEAAKEIPKEIRSETAKETAKEIPSEAPGERERISAPGSTSATVETPPDFAIVPRFDRKKIIMAVAASMGALLLAIAVSALTRAPSEELSARANASASQGATPAPPAGSSAPAPAKAEPTTPFALSANAEVAAVRIEDRAFFPPVPAKEVTLDLTSEEHRHTLTLLARATDGREASVLVPFGATSAAVEFVSTAPPPPVAPAAAAPPAIAAPPIAAAPPRATPQKPPRLAPSPYK
jgi:eukaryotic-like serine/threonine-protein kinase